MSDGSPPDRTTSSRFASVSLQMLQSAAAALAWQERNISQSVIQTPVGEANPRGDKAPFLKEPYFTAELRA